MIEVLDCSPESTREPPKLPSPAGAERRTSERTVDAGVGVAEHEGQQRVDEGVVVRPVVVQRVAIGADERGFAVGQRRCAARDRNLEQHRPVAGGVRQQVDVDSTLSAVDGRSHCATSDRAGERPLFPYQRCRGTHSCNNCRSRELIIVPGYAGRSNAAQRAAASITRRNASAPRKREMATDGRNRRQQDVHPHGRGPMAALLADHGCAR